MKHLACQTWPMVVAGTGRVKQLTRRMSKRLGGMAAIFEQETTINGWGSGLLKTPSKRLGRLISVGWVERSLTFYPTTNVVWKTCPETWEATGASVVVDTMQVPRCRSTWNPTNIRFMEESWGNGSVPSSHIWELASGMGLISKRSKKSF